jgi:acyl-CoA thioesterase-1
MTGQGNSRSGAGKLRSGYGGFAAGVKSRLGVLLAFVLVLSPAVWTGTAHAQSEPVKLAVLGDSIAAGYGLAPDQAFPVRLQAALASQGRKVTVLNHGVSGDTTSGGLERIDWMLADKPDIVLVELGGNDMLRGTDPATTERNLDAIIAKLKGAAVTVWLAGMVAPRNLGPEYTTAFDAIYGKLAAKYDVPLYPFLLDGVAQTDGLNQADGIHPNIKGVDVLIERLLPFVTRNLDLYDASVHRPPRP